MDEAGDPLEKLWDNLLSRQADRIRQAYVQLEADEKQHVLAHLHRMATEPGWHPQQAASARAALQALDPDKSSH